MSFMCKTGTERMTTRVWVAWCSETFYLPKFSMEFQNGGDVHSVVVCSFIFTLYMQVIMLLMNPFYTKHV